MSEDESGQRSGECEHNEHAVCDGTTPGWPCECSCHTPLADDVRDLIERFDHLRNSGVCSPTTRALLDEAQALLVRPRGTVTPTVEEWSEQMDAERARQIEHGYDDAHDVKHGAAHLLNWAIDYARRGNNLAAATMARCALRLPRGTVTDAEVDAAQRVLDARIGLGNRSITRAALEAARNA